MALEMDDRGRALENEYFRRQERELIEKMRSKVNADGVSASGLNCPKCDGKLVETNFENIKIDVCNDLHGRVARRGRTGANHDAGRGKQRLVKPCFRLNGKFKR